MLANSISSNASFPTLHRRHSLYGTEDRVVLDLGSLYIKCGFSGEPRPRHIIPVFARSGRSKRSEGEAYAIPGEFKGLFDLDIMSNKKELEILEDNLNRILHDIYFRYLLTDPKQRKVIICESPLVPVRIKQVIANVLFQNFQVPSISFAPTHLLALLTTGTTTGLVVDCGNLETTVLPIFSSRPMTPFIRTTPLAGRALSTRLLALLLAHGHLIPPSSLPREQAPRSPIPATLLTPQIIEDIKSRFLFVSPVMISERDRPSGDKISEEEMEEKYKELSSASDVYYPVKLDELSSQGRTVMGMILIPGWVRERAAEVLFEGDEDEASVSGCILDCVVRIQTDLRRPLITSLLLIGGMSLLPGFQHRVQQEILRAIRYPTDIEKKKYSRTLKGVVDVVRFLEDRLTFWSTATQDQRPKSEPGAGRLFQGNIRGWVGGSLIGSVRSSGPEVVKEKFSGEVPDWSLNIHVEGQGAAA